MCLCGNPIVAAAATATATLTLTPTAEAALSSSERPLEMNRRRRKWFFSLLSIKCCCLKGEGFLSIQSVFQFPNSSGVSPNLFSLSRCLLVRMYGSQERLSLSSLLADGGGRSENENERDNVAAAASAARASLPPPHCLSLLTRVCGTTTVVSWTGLDSTALN